MTWLIGTYLDITVPAPDPNQVPGGNVISNLVAGSEYLVGVVCVVAFCLGIGKMAFGNKSHNAGMVEGGKSQMLLAAVGMVLLGGLGVILNFFLHMGGTMKG